MDVIFQKSEITWWIYNVASVSQSIDHGNWIFALSTDASDMVRGQSWKLSIPRIENNLQWIDGLSTKSWTTLMC